MVELVLLAPITQCLRRAAKTPGQFARRAALAHQLDGFSTELLRILRTGPRHTDRNPFAGPGPQALNCPSNGVHSTSFDVEPCAPPKPAVRSNSTPSPLPTSSTGQVARAVDTGRATARLCLRPRTASTHRANKRPWSHRRTLPTRPQILPHRDGGTTDRCYALWRLVREAWSPGHYKGTDSISLCHA